MNNKRIVLVTGANSGIGKVTAIELAKNGDLVIMLCRNKERGEKALIEVKEASKNNDVELMLCDLSSIDDIKTFCIEFKSKYKSLDVLINNAGVMLTKRYESKDSFELQFHVNYLAPFILTKSLLDIMSNNGRVINVSSLAHKFGKIYFDDINLKSNFYLLRGYSQSKLALNLFTFELARRLSNTNISVNCLHPGIVASNIVVNRDTGMGNKVAKLMKHLFISPEKGAETTIYLATTNDKISGKYLVKKKVTKSSKTSNIEELAKKLWNFTEELLNK